VKVPCCSRSCNRRLGLFLPLPQGGKAWPEDEPEARRPCHRIIFLGYLRLRDREEDKLCTQTIVPFFSIFPMEVNI